MKAKSLVGTPFLPLSQGSEGPALFAQRQSLFLESALRLHMMMTQLMTVGDKKIGARKRSQKENDGATLAVSLNFIPTMCSEGYCKGGIAAMPVCSPLLRTLAG